MRKTGFLLLFLWGVFFQNDSHAHGGEDHGDAQPALPVQGIAPRFSVSSDELELVAVFRPPQLIIYVDHYADNTPLTQAKLELEGAGVKGVAKETAPGVYVMTLPELKPAAYPFTISIESDELADLLAASLTVPADDANKAPGHDTHGGQTGDRTWVLMVGALLLAVAGLILLSVYWRRRTAQASRSGGRNHA